MRAPSMSSNIAGVEHQPKGPLYRIRVRGVLSETLLHAFPGLEALTDRGDTVLVGALPDQAALYGVLGEVEALGLELLEVSQIPAGGDPRTIEAR
jgi:hypothetical protein